MPCQVKPGWLSAGTFTQKQLLFSEILPKLAKEVGTCHSGSPHIYRFEPHQSCILPVFVMHPLGLIIILMSLSFTIFDILSVRLWWGLVDMLSFQVVPKYSLLWGKATARDSQAHIPGRLDIALPHLERKSLINKLMTSGDLHPRLVTQRHPQRGYRTQPSTAFPWGVRDLSSHIISCGDGQGQTWE